MVTLGFDFRKNQMHRRQVLQYSLASCATLLANPSLFANEPSESPKFTMDLCPSRVGISAGQLDLIALAKKTGFTSVQPLAWHLAKLDEGQIKDLTAKLEEAGLCWSAADLSVEFRKDDAAFGDGLKRLVEEAKALQVAGVTRMGTWIMPCHDELTYVANFRQHASRLTKIAKVLNDHGIRLGLEYVGTKSLWTNKKYPFLHTMKEAKDLIAETGQSNLGFVLDSWHWAMAGETPEDIRGLKNSDIVACDLNDAPAGVEPDSQIDNVRELPMATGVLNTKGFLQALVDVEYDGPIRAEPFNKPLNEMGDAQAAEATAAAMKKAFALVGSNLALSN